MPKSSSTNAPDERKRATSPLLPALAILLVASAFLANWILPMHFLTNWNDRSAFGQLFGPASALFTGLGIVGLLYNIRLQQAQIRMAREQAASTERSQAEAQKVIANQLRVLVEQTIVLTNSLTVQAQSSVADRQLNIDRMLVQHPEIWECFDDDVTIGVGDPRYTRALAMSQCLANYFDTYLLQKERFAQLYSDDAWTEYIKGYFAKSPILRRFVADHSGWYTRELLSLAGSAQISPTERSA